MVIDRSNHVLWVGVLVAAAFVAGACSTTRVETRPPTSCDYGGWSAPRAVRGVPAGSTPALRRGRLHLVWGEPHPDSTLVDTMDFLRPNVQITTVWMAAYSPESG